MTTKSIRECERKRLMNTKYFQLPNSFKKLGVALFVGSMVALFANKFAADSETFKQIARYGLLISCLIISISKEPIEDELIAKLRMQSYTFAFVLGVFFTMCLPFVDYLLDWCFKNGKANFKDLGDFEILWFLLSIQVFYFEYLKRVLR